LTNQLIEAVKVIEEHGLKYKEDKLTLANIHRLFSVVLMKEGNIEPAITQIDDSIKHFTRIHSNSGLALCYLFKSFLTLEEQDEMSFLSCSENSEFLSTMSKPHSWHI